LTENNRFVTVLGASSPVSGVLPPIVTTAAQIDPVVRGDLASRAVARVVTDGKFLLTGGQRFLAKGVTYGTFAPDAQGYQLPPSRQVANDFRLMASLGINTVRLYTAPCRELLDEADRHDLRVMVGLPWSQHVAFLDDPRQVSTIRREVTKTIAELSDHPAVLMFVLGNEIPPGVVRWHGRIRIEHFLRQLYQDGKATSPDSLFTYGNFPPTEFLDLSFLDVCAFNVYLHRDTELRAYLARLQHVAGQRPLLLAEAGSDSIREGEAGQADITAMHARVAFEEGACGAIAFAWTDEWWRGGHPVEDWRFGLVDRERRFKPAATAVSSVFAEAPFPPEAKASWPRVSVIVCAFNAADTIEDCLTSLEGLVYPDYEIILVNDGSLDRTSEIGHSHLRVRVIDTPNHGLGAARNLGLAEATGEVVTYTDADVRVDRDWLTFLVQPLLPSTGMVGSGGPNLVPVDDPPMAQCIARAPGGPTHVLLDDRVAEHVPGCNMAFRREALLAIGGFNPIYLRAGDDVDVCWRLQARGWKIGFAPAALVWHHHRSSLRSYWRQQVGYGEGETWLMGHHPEKFLDGKMLWRGSIYSSVPFVRSLRGTRVNSGVWGTAAFPSVYRTDVHPFAFLPHSIRWQLISFILTLAGAIVAVSGGHPWAAAVLFGSGLVGIAVTVAKNLAYALRSEVSSVPRSRIWSHATIACLHFLQPFARARGRIRGMLAPPEVVQSRIDPQASHRPRPSIADGWRALLLISGSVIENRYWAEVWTSADRYLTLLTTALRRSRAVRTVVIDEGWSDDRDVSVFVGRWGWLDVRALVEDHGSGKCLLRLSTHLRPTAFGLTAALTLGVLLLGAISAGVAYRWPVAGVVAALMTAAVSACAAWRTAQAAAIVGREAAGIARAEGMVTMPSGPARAPLIAPTLLRTYGLRSAIIFAVMILALGSGAMLLREVFR
jgi:GT2 family glycosyltransferase